VSQHPLPFEAATQVKHLRSGLTVLDLFSGIGGLASGFRDNGFSVIGVDREQVAGKVFPLTGGGEFVQADLGTTMVMRSAEVIIGGPPCRPWSAVNQQRRRREHEDHGLLSRFFEHVREIRPEAFLMENVPAVGSDASFLEWIEKLRGDSYRLASRLLRYSDYGAATTRTRRFTVGFRDSYTGAREFFTRLQFRKRAATTVHEAIHWARGLARDAVPDHDWSRLRTIEKYKDRYQSGQYGWKQLAYGVPAPSFGSISKTYILHPEAGIEGFPLRVLSVREALSIMGFTIDVKFPDGTPRALRYQMVANAVSPIVSGACAGVMHELIAGIPGELPVLS
jgi:DNA (cytosine-5)-methyltransferase 1